MAVLRARKLWNVIIPGTGRLEEAPHPEAPLPGPEALVWVFACPAGHRAIVRHISCGVTSYNMLVTQSVWVTLLPAASSYLDSGNVYNHFFRQRVTAEAEPFQPFNLSLMLVMDAGDTIGMGSNLASNVYSQGSGMIMPLPA